MEMYGPAACGSPTTAKPIFRKVTRYQTATHDALSAAAVALIVKRVAQAAGLTPFRLAPRRLPAQSPRHVRRLMATPTSPATGAVPRSPPYRSGCRRPGSGAGRCLVPLASGTIHTLDGPRPLRGLQDTEASIPLVTAIVAARTCSPCPPRRWICATGASRLIRRSPYAEPRIAYPTDAPRPGGLIFLAASQTGEHGPGRVPG